MREWGNFRYVVIDYLVTGGDYLVDSRLSYGAYLGSTPTCQC
jgi:hypothetical protein